MAEAKRQRELTQGDEDASATIAASPAAEMVLGISGSGSGNRQEEVLSVEEIKLRNDRQRFADLLENSLTNGSGGGDFDRGYYLTVEQENENADAVCKSIALIAPTFIWHWMS